MPIVSKKVFCMRFGHWLMIWCRWEKLGRCLRYFSGKGRYQRGCQIGKKKRKCIWGKSSQMFCSTLSGSLTFVVLILVKLPSEKLSLMPLNTQLQLKALRVFDLLGWGQFPIPQLHKKNLYRVRNSPMCVSFACIMWYLSVSDIFGHICVKYVCLRILFVGY